MRLLCNTYSYLKGGTDPKHIHFIFITTDFTLKGISFIRLNHGVILNSAQHLVPHHRQHNFSITKSIKLYRKSGTKRIDIHECIRTYIHTYIQKCIYTYMCLNTHTHTHTQCELTYTDTYIIHAHTYVRTYTYIYIYLHNTYTYIHTST